KLIQLTLLFPVLIAFEAPQQHILIGISLFALAGVWIGGKIRHRLSQQHFKYIVLSLLFILGLYALWQSAALIQQSNYSIFK
ncbi:MAG: sulfite exporter TauE/SafE family protein, partial [Acinetobacter sp.]